jgi:outer membrane protein OmpA-like peptidoglycan-associated protein
MRIGNNKTVGASLWVLVTFSILVLTPYLSGCAAFVAVGAGTGAYSYISGNVLRTYDADYQQTIRASRKALNDLKFTLINETSDGIITEIKGRRGDDTPVTIKVTFLNSLQSEVGVRTGVVGVTETEFSEKVHDKIADGLIQYARSIKTLSPAATKKFIPVEEGIGAKPEPVRYTESGGGNNKQTTDLLRPAQNASLPDNNLKHGRPSQSSVYLYYGKSDLAIPAGEYDTLDRVADFLLTTTGTKLEIFGYTDSTGDDSTNLSNSIHRVKAIKNYFIAKGVEEKRISAQGFGATNFLGSNKNEQLRKMNRRVELHIR